MMSSTNISARRAGAGFPIALAALALMMASASLPSPFYPAFQEEMGFSAAAMSGIFAIYAVALLITLLIAGSSSDHVGRRPILSLGFLLLAGAGMGFVMADSVQDLFATRALQGVACGLLLTTLSATTVDLEPPSMPGIAAVCNSVVPLLALALGAPVAGIVMDAAATPKTDVFGGMTLVSLALAGIVWILPETSPRHEGLLQALKPQLGLPKAARKMFWTSAPAIAAGWATGGLYLALGAPIVAHVFGLHDYVMQATVVSLLSASGAIACFVARKFPARAVMLYGTAALAIGTLATLAGIAVANFPLYLAALAVAGTGFGTCFYGALRSLIPVTPADERGELFASIFTLSYLAFGIPVVIAGLAVPYLGLKETVLVYGAVIAAISAMAGLWRWLGTTD